MPPLPQNGATRNDRERRAGASTYLYLIPATLEAVRGIFERA